MRSKIKDQIKFEEGLKLSVYLCPAGKRTIGYGHNLDASPTLEGNKIPDEITEEIADVLLDNDIRETIRLLSSSWKGFELLSGARRDALINMCFQLGIGKLSGFQRMHAALMKCDWSTTYNEAMASTWAKQCHLRANRVATQFLTGKHYEVGNADI